MASNPILMPSRGPRKLTKTKKGGRVPSDTVNSFRKKKGFSESVDFTAFPIFASAVYTEPRHVRAISISKIMNLQLRI